jgi:ribosomal subunit interface protein
MKLSISGKQIDVGEALQGHVRQALEGTVGKYFDNALDGSVQFSREAHLLRCDIQVHARRGIFMQAEAAAEDAYLSFDRALERMGKRLRRYKRRLRDHNAQQAGEIESVAAQQFVLRAENDDHVDGPQEPERLDPVVIAEMQTRLHTLTVGEAVMRLDLTGDAAMMFRNSAHGGWNMVYRRTDGNIGWVDPQNLNRTVNG